MNRNKDGRLKVNSTYRYYLAKKSRIKPKSFLFSRIFRACSFLRIFIHTHSYFHTFSFSRIFIFFHTFSFSRIFIFTHFSSRIFIFTHFYFHAFLFSHIFHALSFPRIFIFRAFFPRIFFHAVLSSRIFSRFFLSICVSCE